MYPKESKSLKGGDKSVLPSCLTKYVWHKLDVYQVFIKWIDILENLDEEIQKC